MIPYHHLPHGIRQTATQSSFTRLKFSHDSSRQTQQVYRLSTYLLHMKEHNNIIALRSIFFASRKPMRRLRKSCFFEYTVRLVASLAVFSRYSPPCPQLVHTYCPGTSSIAIKYLPDKAKTGYKI